MMAIPEVLHELGGNAMHVRTVAVAICTALMLTSSEKMKEALSAEP